MLRINVLGLDLLGCHEALERLDDFVDRELSPAETRKVNQHLRICRECARKFAFEKDFVDGMRGKVEHIAPPADISALKSSLSQALRQQALEPAPNDQAHPPPEA